VIGDYPTRIVAAFISRFSICVLSVSAVHAADLGGSSNAPVIAAPEAFPRWYVRFGVLGAIDQSTSNLFSQSLASVVVPGIGLVPIGGTGPQTLLTGRGATYSNAFTAGVQVGYFFSQNWSLELAGGVPVWVKVRITGFSAAAPLSGTVLSEILPAAVPITAVYHFTQLGALQPYLGAGIEPSFLLSIRDRFSTGGSFKPTLGLVLQGGFDYMFNRNWGVFFDLKKVFAESTGHATGINFGPPIGTIPVDSTIKTSAQPWLFTTGITCRF
jgi:outer membrane protein